MRTFGLRRGGIEKSVIVSFVDAFHGRTMGAQQLGGTPAGKAWIKNLDRGDRPRPLPRRVPLRGHALRAFRNDAGPAEDRSPECRGRDRGNVSGRRSQFHAESLRPALRQWCDRHGALLCFDEVQAGFGRCGTLWGFELYGVIPDLFCLGKGISSSLPISAVIGRPDVMDLYGPNEMTSTHSGNAVCCAAALASIETIFAEKLIENAARLGPVLKQRTGGDQG